MSKTFRQLLETTLSTTEKWDRRWSARDLETFNDDAGIDLAETIEALLNSSNLDAKQRQWFTDYAIERVLNLYRVKFTGSKYLDRNPGEWVGRWLMRWLENFETNPSRFVIRHAWGVDLRESAEPRRRIDQTETPEFKRWFGNSKVVDANGKPLVVYHGTRSDFAEVNTSDRGFDESVANQLGDNIGSFFTSKSATAADFAERGQLHGVRPTTSDINNRVPTKGAAILPAYLAIRNPAMFRDQLEWRQFLRSNAKPRQALEDKGYDGVVIRKPGYSGKHSRELWYVAFHPNQIKSAIGNRGTFNPNSSNINESSH